MLKGFITAFGLLGFCAFAQENTVELPEAGQTLGNGKVAITADGVLLLYSSKDGDYSTDEFKYYDKELNLRWSAEATSVQDFVLQEDAILFAGAYTYAPIKLQKMSLENGEILKSVSVFQERSTKGSVLSQAAAAYKDYFAFSENATMVSVVSIPESPALDKNWTKWYTKKNVQFEIVVWTYDKDLALKAEHHIALPDVTSIKWEIIGEPTMDNAGNVYFSMWNEQGTIFHHRVDPDGQMTTVTSELLTRFNNKEKPVYIAEAHAQNKADGYTVFYKTKATMFLEPGKYSDFGTVGKDLNIAIETQSVDFEDAAVERQQIIRFTPEMIEERGWKKDIDIRLRSVVSIDDRHYFLTHVEDMDFKNVTTHSGDTYYKYKYRFVGAQLINDAGEVITEFNFDAREIKDLSRIYRWLGHSDKYLYSCYNDLETGAHLAQLNTETNETQITPIVQAKKSEWLVTQFYSTVDDNRFYYVLTSRKSGKSKLKLMHLKVTTVKTSR